MESKLGNIAELKTGPFGTQLHASEYVTEGIPIINVKNIGYGEINDKDLDYVSTATAERLNTHLLMEGDIVFGRKGSVDRHAYIDERYEGWMQGSDCIRVRCLNPEVNRKYLSHFFNLDYVKKQLLSGSVGSTMPSMNTDILKSLNIVLPDKRIQDDIEIILSAINCKIDNNLDVCSDLESMSKLLYDYWFVQFDFPDENGKPYKSSGGKMIWNEELKREIPEGWEVKSLSDVFEITMGSSPKGDSLNEEGNGIEFYQGSTDFGDLYPSIRVFTTAPVRHAKSQDILMSVRAPVGDMNIAMNDCCIGRGLAAIHHRSTIYAWCTMLTFQPFFNIYNGNGTTFGALTSDDLKRQLTIVPNQSVLELFFQKVDVVGQKLRELSIENQQLASLRDFLLPMLMNGQVKVGKEDS